MNKFNIENDIVVPIICTICEKANTKYCEFGENKSNNICSCLNGKPTQHAIKWAFKYIEFMTDLKIKESELEGVE